MRQFTDGAIFVRGLTSAEKQAAWAAATRDLGLRSLSELGCFLIRQYLAQRHGMGRPAKVLPADVARVGASRITRKVAQWRSPSAADPRGYQKKNSPRKRPPHHSGDDATFSSSGNPA